MILLAILTWKQSGRVSGDTPHLRGYYFVLPFLGPKNKTKSVSLFLPLFHFKGKKTKQVLLNSVTLKSQTLFQKVPEINTTCCYCI